MLENDLNHLIDQVAKDKGFEREIIIEALEAAMLQAAQKRRETAGRNIEAHYNREAADLELYEFRKVVDTIQNPLTEISITEAREYDPEAQLGDELGIKLDTRTFGRIDAMAAKAVILQKVREAERDQVYADYKNRKGEIITGIARRFERGDIIVDLGKAEAVLPSSHLLPNDNYRAGDRVKAFVMDVTKVQRGPQIILSRTVDEMLVKLFDAEVPEIHEGIVRIENVARDPGARSKIAVSSRDPDVDPVGACVGMKGSRVQAVVRELGGEKIDIVPYDSEPARFVCNALLPAEVSRVIIDKGRRCMEVVVPDDQLSLAIGRKGQNVRLAAMLAGWKLDIHSEGKFKEMRGQAIENLKRIGGLGATLAEVFYTQGLRSVKEVADSDVSRLCKIPGVTEEFAARLIGAAQDAYIKLLEEEAEKAALAEKQQAEAAAAQAQAESQAEAEVAHARVEGVADQVQAEAEVAHARVEGVAERVDAEAGGETAAGGEPAAPAQPVTEEIPWDEALRQGSQPLSPPAEDRFAGEPIRRRTEGEQNGHKEVLTKSSEPEARAKVSEIQREEVLTNPLEPKANKESDK